MLGVEMGYEGITTQPTEGIGEGDVDQFGRDYSIVRL